MVSHTVRIGIDLMGGDSSPDSLFQGSIKALEQLPSVSIVYLATWAFQSSIEEILKKIPQSIRSRISFEWVHDYISMEAIPIAALRKQKGASVLVGMRLLKTRKIDALLSMGNTGALLAAATLTLPLLPGIRRPALLALLPSEKGNVAVLDVGGNLSCKAAHLVQFALMGAAYQRCCGPIERPRVGLLNIGVESKKGTSEIQKAYQQLQEMESSPQLEFIGNVEGRDVFKGAVDVLIADGFTGNVFLKTVEGTSLFLMHELGVVLSKHQHPFQNAILSQLKERFHYEKQHGAFLCGVDALVMKCHGATSSEGIAQGVAGLVRMVNMNLVKAIKQQLANCLIHALE